jgi:hypothetical protein
MNASGYYLLPFLPQGLENLVELALDFRWSWNHAAAPRIPTWNLC